MIKNSRLLEKFENDLVAESKPDFKKNMKIFEAMYKHAKATGALKRSDPLEGLETVIRLAKILNSVPKTNKKNR